jgi:hypothetical protein
MLEGSEAELPLSVGLTFRRLLIRRLAPVSKWLGVPIEISDHHKTLDLDATIRTGQTVLKNEESVAEKTKVRLSFSNLFPYLFALTVVAMLVVPPMYARYKSASALDLCKIGQESLSEMSGVVRVAGSSYYIQGKDSLFLATCGRGACSDGYRALSKNLGSPIKATICNGRVLSYSVGGATFDR